MSATEYELNVFKALDYIKANSAKYAKAKAKRIELEEFRKSKKAILMKEAEINGVSAANAQEREAYANPEYMQLIKGLAIAVEEEEKLRFLIEGAKLQIEVWRTQEASKRLEIQTLS